MSMEKKTILPDCSACEYDNSEKFCRTPKGKPGKGCPGLTRKDVLEEANQEYNDPDIREFARQSAIQEAECYANRHQKPYIMQPSKTRVQEICEFAQKMGYKRIGLAFCGGLAREAAVFGEILKIHGFEVVSAICKAGATPKETIGLTEEEMVHHPGESMCNPIFQAKVLNNDKTDFNVLLGLCVGHDSLFFKYAEAPTTVLAVKDRVTGHNPLAPIYLNESYYRKLKHPEIL